MQACDRYTKHVIAIADISQGFRLRDGNAEQVTKQKVYKTFGWHTEYVTEKANLRHR